MNNIQHIQRFSRSHSLVSAAHAQQILTLANAPEISADTTEQTMEAMCQTFGAVRPEQAKPYLTVGNVAVIPMHGSLLHRGAWASPWATGYSYISSAFNAALHDDEVKGIVFDVNSFGGHVAGNFELAEEIYAARGQKPTLALVDSHALSGGYSLSSAADRIVASPSSDVGSIGVLLMHVSLEQALKNVGVEISLIHAGKHKVDGNPFEDLPDDVRSVLQSSVEKSYSQFVSLVARNRGLDTEAVRNTEARVYDAEEAKSLGLIDDVMSPRAAFAAFLSEVSNASTQPKKVKNMSNETPEKKAGDEAGANSDTPTVDTAALTAQASTAERERIAAIMGSEEAKDRPALANHLALNTTMSAEDAKATLAASAVETKTASKGPLAQAMDDEGGPNVGDGGDEGGGQQMSAGERIARAHAKASGYSLRTEH